MDANSSGEELALKMRKPYTITKQRERWSEEEHNRFLEALKLYGRAWQKIEEHIGTKTAIQIRSHAQKFFTKLEKEALAKGIPPGQAHDIDIPPPRPKRKPSIPYPRKTTGFPSSTGEATADKGPKLSSEVLIVEGVAPQEKFSTLKRTLEGKEISEDVSCSEVLDVQDTLSASISSVNKSSTSRTFREFFPVSGTIKDNEINKTSVPVNVNKDPGKSGTDVAGAGVLKNNANLQINLVEEEDTLAMQGLTLEDKNSPPCPDKQLMLHDIGGNCEEVQCNNSNKGNSTTVNGQAGGHGHINPLVNSSGSGIPSGFQNYTPFGPVHPMFPAVAPFIHCQSDQDSYQSLLNMSSTFSNLIISTLLQNPAVHAAASMAASFWPAPHVNTSTQSQPEVQNGAIPERNVNSPPRTAAIAAATVAAAAAWWATQGLLPCFPPVFGFGFAPAAATEVTKTPEGHDVTVHEPMKENQTAKMADQAVEPQHYTSKTSASSSSLSESDENERDENSHSIELNDGKPTKSRPLTVDENTDVTNCKEKQYRSSCGSNTPSSSDIETDTVPKDDNAPDVAKEAYFANPLAVDANHRRFRTVGSLNESWKEVSQEGRLAFRALFSREILPQSFSPPQHDDTTKKGEEDSSKPVDPNKNLCSMADINPHNGFTKDEGSEKRIATTGECSTTTESGHEKFKVSLTGFKPYKRCSVESKDGGAATANETGNKRIRIEGQAST